MQLHRITLLMAGLLTVPAFADHHGGGSHATGPRGGSVTHAQGPNRGSATHVQGPNRSQTVVRAPQGGRVVVGRPGYAGRPGYYGRPGYAGRPGYYSRPAYNWHGRHYARPGWAPGRIDVYRRGFYRYPGYRAYGTYYGLVPPLAAFGGLAFLSAGLLTASYLANDHTVYVYIVNENGQNVEYRVDDTGQILSQQIVP